jgi:hypothetical protein
VIEEGCTLVCESSDFAHVFGGDESLASKFEILREARYGIACVTVMRLTEVQA